MEGGLLFWNVDTQIDFMNAEGNLYVDGAERIKPTLAALTRFAKDHNITVVNTCDWHHKDSLELSEQPDFVSTFPPHCMAHSFGAEYVTETMPTGPIQIIPWDKEKVNTELSARNVVIQKDRFNVFEGNPHAEDFVRHLAKLNMQQIIIYGVATNVCVSAAVEGLSKRGFKVTVIEDAIKELPGIPNPLENWRNNDKIAVLGSKALFDALAKNI